MSLLCKFVFIERLSSIRRDLLNSLPSFKLLLASSLTCPSPLINAIHGRKGAHEIETFFCSNDNHAFAPPRFLGGSDQGTLHTTSPSAYAQNHIPIPTT